MSRTFSTKNGSVESLKCRWRWGSRPNPRQMRCTVDFESRVWPAIYRTLQCVPPFGFVSSVLRTNWASRSSLIGRGRPERNSSCSPDTPCSRKRRRDLPSREELFSVVAVRLAPCNYPARSGRRDFGHGVAHGNWPHGSIRTCLESVHCTFREREIAGYERVAQTYREIVRSRRDTQRERRPCFPGVRLNDRQFARSGSLQIPDAKGKQTGSGRHGCCTCEIPRRVKLYNIQSPHFRMQAAQPGGYSQVP
jgi:hypothetical protein